MMLADGRLIILITSESSGRYYRKKEAAESQSQENEGIL